MIPFSPLVEALLLWTVVVPLIVAVPLALIGWLSGETAHTGRLRGMDLAALCGAFLACFVGIRGWPGFPPGPATDWLFYLALLTGAGETVIRMQTRLPAVLLRGLVVGVGIVVCLAPIWPRAGSYAVLLGQGILFGGGVVVVLWNTDRLSRRTTSPVVPLSFVILSVGAAAVFAGSGSLTLAQLAGSLGTGLFPLFVVSLLSRDLDLRASLSYLVLTLGFVSLQAWLYSDTPVESLLLLGASSLFIATLTWRRLRERAFWLPAAVCLASTVLLVAGSVFLTTLPSPTADGTADTSSDSGSYRPYR